MHNERTRTDTSPPTARRTRTSGLRKCLVGTGVVSGGDNGGRGRGVEMLSSRLAERPHIRLPEVPGEMASEA